MYRQFKTVTIIREDFNLPETEPVPMSSLKHAVLAVTIIREYFDLPGTEPIPTSGLQKNYKFRRKSKQSISENKKIKFWVFSKNTPGEYSKEFVLAI